MKKAGLLLVALGVLSMAGGFPLLCIDSCGYLLGIPTGNYFYIGIGLLAAGFILMHESPRNPDSTSDAVASSLGRSFVVVGGILLGLFILLFSTFIIMTWFST